MAVRLVMLQPSDVEGAMEVMIAATRARYAMLLADHPLERYVHCLEKYPQECNLTHVSAAVQSCCEDITTRYGENAMNQYHKLVLLKLIARAINQLPAMDLPDDVRVLFHQNFTRIIRDSQADCQSPGNYLYRNAHFHKDLAVCSLRLIPCGARKVHLNRLPLRPLFATGVRAFVRATRMVIFDLAGLGPLYEWHTDSHDPEAMSEFNAEGWIRLHCRLADLLSRNPIVRGAFAGSWLYDPQLEVVSPRLAYMRDLVVNNGGMEFCVGPCDAEGIALATLKSATRKSLYREGKYAPMNWMLVWPRKQLIQWASKNQINRDDTTGIA